MPAWRTLADGEDLDGLRIIHTPGHSPGHVCIGVGNILLSADHILARTVPQQWPESVAAYTGLGHYLDSLEKIERMPGFELTLAAHEQAIHDLYGRIETIRGAHVRRLDRLLDMLGEASGPLSIDEITRRLYPEVTGFRAVLAITDVGSRVEYLHQRGRLAVANLDEVEREQNAGVSVLRGVRGVRTLITLGQREAEVSGDKSLHASLHHATLTQVRRATGYPRPFASGGRLGRGRLRDRDSAAARGGSIPAPRRDSAVPDRPGPWSWRRRSDRG